ncbi:unnamed protein product [Rhizoctonia solani]|uniref:Fungal-type protein kinase domain-containing protein n=1 Tax=Rhizoctonia solani TaxID=456999 RepID=A0A8H3DQJ9_9AGAM|nr:unnamed protein product [Rhizoctonia solani]
MVVVNGDSPTRPKYAHAIDYRSIRVVDSRKPLTKDIPVVSEVSLDSLIHMVLRDVPTKKLNKVCDKLSGAGCIIRADSDHPRWNCFPLSPRAAKKPEARVFQSLEAIAKDIIKHSGISQPIVHLKVAGEITPLSNRRNTSRPDGFFRMGSVESEPVRWADIIMPMEFKNESSRTNQTDDFEKVLWSMHHIMRNDPRRKYVHGLTCENTEMRLWFHDRSDVVASRKFDINKDWKSLVKIILSMLLATPVELGYDPTVQAVTLNDGTSEPSYDITIHNVEEDTKNVYRTVGILSDVGADSMVCRATRVWTVQKLVDGVPDGHLYALKDIWVHEDRVPEHEILREIRKEQPKYTEYFLTPLDHGFVPLDPNAPQIANSTHKPLGHRRDLDLTGESLCICIAPSHRSPDNQETPGTPRDSVGHSADIPNGPSGGAIPFRLSKHARHHYRIVFKEIGKPVHGLRNFTDVFIAIRGGWEGLHAMHLCGYVHRDVSSGNILLVEPHGNKRGVIMDLEYAKKMDDMNEPHDVKTGTAAFMATEVASAEHHRLGLLRTPCLGDLPPVFQPLSSEPPQLPPFRHNPLHDMESVWWLCVWMMFYLSHSKGKSWEQLQNYYGIFDSQATKKYFSELIKFKQLTSHLSETPAFVSTIYPWLVMLNRFYSDCYEQQSFSANPPAILQVDDKTTDLSYEYGCSALRALEEGSEPLPECITLYARRKKETKQKRLVFDGVHMPPPKKRRTQQ